jgi:hypothetical protein
MAQVIQTGPWFGDALQQSTAQDAAVKRIQAMRGFREFTKNAQQAHKSADAFGGVIYTVPAVTKGSGARYPVYGVVIPDGAGGGGTGGTGGGANATGMVPANASIKGFTGGGVQDIGATNIQGVGIAVLGEFLGVDFQTAETKLPEGKSPDALSVEGMGRGGTLSLRPGLIAFHPKRNDAAPSAVPNAYKGRSINILSAAMAQSTHMSVLLGYDQSSVIGTSLASTCATYVKKMKPLWHPQKDIAHVPPKIKLTDSVATGGIVFNISMPLAFRKNAPTVASVDQLIVRRSALTYPQDRDGKDDTASSIVATRDYTAYDGTSTAITDTSVTAGQTRFYSVWCVSKLQETPRASLRVVTV